MIRISVADRNKGPAVEGARAEQSSATAELVRLLRPLRRKAIVKSVAVIRCSIKNML